MTTRRSTLAAGLALTLAVGGYGSTAAAQNFTKPVHIIIPYAPGGSSDLLARLMGPKISESIGQPVVVENKTGGSGNVGADFVAKAPPDGHTVLLTDVGNLSTSPVLFKKLSFDLMNDLVPVTMVAFAPYLFAIHPSVPANDLKELTTYGKANPGKINVGNAGVGTSNHLTGIIVGKHLGINWNHVPYRGGAAAIKAVVANESNAIFNGAAPTTPFAVQGQLRGIAVTGEKRLAALPNVPSFKELNLPAVDAGTWQGLMTSKGTSPEMVSRLNAEFHKALAIPEISQKITDMGFEVRPTSPQELGAWVKGSMEQWGKVVREENIQLD
jgi:tripartite-type tricarboxylate transporter receptor subunit TctC